jgi:hypothetical protein
VYLLLVATSAVAASPRKLLTSAEIRRVFGSHVVTDGAHWRYYLKADGAVDAVDMGRQRSGRWRVDDDQLCVRLVARAAEEECWEVTRRVHGFSFQINGQDLFDVTVEAPP